MNVLEKILEEIEEATFQEDAPVYVGDVEVDGYVRASRVKEIIRSHMDEVENDGWISVEDRLPEKSGYYIASIYDDEDEEHRIEITWFHRKEDESDEDEWCELYDCQRVTAWQPFPKPYK